MTDLCALWKISGKCNGNCYYLCAFIQPLKWETGQE